MNIHKTPATATKVLDKLRHKTQEEAIEQLEDRGLIVYNADDLPVANPEKSHTLKEDEVYPLVLAYVCFDFRLSSKAIAKSLKISPDTVRKIRDSEKFKKMYADKVGSLLGVYRAEALQTLREIYSNPKTTDRNRIESSKAILTHSSEVAEFLLKREEQSKINVDDVLRELDDLGFDEDDYEKDIEPIKTIKQYDIEE